MKHKLVRFGKAFLLLLLALQLIPLDRSNPPVESELSAPEPIAATLKRSCYDCHSNRTRWPWYSYVAPVSFLVVRDVHEAREEMNLTTWNRYNAKKQEKLLEEMAELVEEEEMPLPIYRIAHPDARLSENDRAALVEWAESGGREANELEPELPEDGQPPASLEEPEGGGRGRGRGRGRGEGGR
ncbi:MAG: heme-binding domain-containing protein [Armatimonadetes bacterium]|nr:heme-binding domain-containing protein [Armatimonadota bacterium]